MMFNSKKKLFNKDHQLALNVNRIYDQFKEETELFEDLYANFLISEEVILFDKKAYILNIERGNYDASNCKDPYFDEMHRPEMELCWMKTDGSITHQTFYIESMCVIQEAYNGN